MKTILCITTGNQQVLHCKVSQLAIKGGVHDLPHILVHGFVPVKNQSDGGSGLLDKIIFVAVKIIVQWAYV